MLLFHKKTYKKPSRSACIYPSITRAKAGYKITILADENRCAKCGKITIVSDGHDHKDEKDQREPPIIVEQIDGICYTFDTENCALMFKSSLLLLSEGLENIVRIKPPFNRYTMFSLFQIPSNFNTVKKQYITIAPLTKKLYLIGERGLTNGTTLSNTEIIDSSGSGLEKNWLIIVITQDEGCALVAEDFETGRYRGFFTTNMNLTNRCVAVLTDLLHIQKVDF